MTQGTGDLEVVGTTGWVGERGQTAGRREHHTVLELALRPALLLTRHDDTLHDLYAHADVLRVVETIETAMKVSAFSKLSVVFQNLPSSLK